MCVFDSVPYQNVLRALCSTKSESESKIIIIIIHIKWRSRDAFSKIYIVNVFDTVGHKMKLKADDEEHLER